MKKSKKLRESLEDLHDMMVVESRAKEKTMPIKKLIKKLWGLQII